MKNKKHPDSVYFADNIMRESRRITDAVLECGDERAISKARLIERLLSVLGEAGYALLSRRDVEVPGWLSEMVPALVKAEKERNDALREVMNRVFMSPSRLREVEGVKVP